LPVTRRAPRAARVITLAALAIALALIAYLLFTGGGYHVKLTFENASQLVTGDQIKVGGVPVGSIDSITLSDDGRALIDASIGDSGLVPLHRGTTAVIRSASLSGVANRYVALTPGPNSAPEIPSGGSVPADSSTSEVDLDEVLNTLNASTLHDLQEFVRGSQAALSGRGDQFGRALTALDPALVQFDGVEQQVLADQQTFTRFLVESADVVSAVAPQSGNVEQLVSSTRATLDTLAARDSAIDDLLRRTPPMLRLTNTTLVNLRNTLVDADPTIRAAQPVAPVLAEFLTKLGPVAQRSVPVVRSLRRTIDRPGSNDLLGVLAGIPPLERITVPAFGSAVATVQDALPIVDEIRPYTPDFVSAITNGYGGATSGYYDANGHYTRISVHSGVYSFTDLGQLLPLPPTTPGITGYRNHLQRRCPGAAIQPAPDGSNPIDLPNGVCDPAENPR
jgi:phospholipid/cholesterol/gamma-HCH transport system substrate-binding protein